jgi:hypothetical protein
MGDHHHHHLHRPPPPPHHHLHHHHVNTLKPKGRFPHVKPFWHYPICIVPCVEHV